LCAFGAESIPALAAAIEQAKAGDPLSPVTVVPPRNHSGLDARRRLGRRGGLLNVRFMVLERLAEFLGAAHLPAGKQRPLTGPVRYEAVRAVLQRDASMFRPVAGHPATIAAIAAAFRELAEAPLEEVEALGASGPRPAEVLRLFKHFGRLTAGYYDRPDLFAAATRAARAGVEPHADIGHVVLFLPEAPSGSRAHFLYALNETGRLSAVIGLHGDSTADEPVLAFARSLDPLPSLPLAVLPAASRVVTATDADEEVRTVVALVLAALEAGTPAPSIACFYADEATYRRLLAEQLGAAGVPFNEVAGEALATTPAGRLLLGLLRLAREGLSRRALLDWLSSAPIRHDTAGVPVRIWNRLSRDAGIAGGTAARWRAALDHHAAELVPRRDEAVAQGRDGAVAAFEREMANCHGLARFVEELAAALGAPGPQRWTHWVAWAQALLHGYFDRPLPEVPAVTTALDAIDRALEALATLDELPGVAPVARDVFEAAVLQSLASTMPPSARFGHGVLVAPLPVATGLTFDHTFVLGAVEGLLPGSEREDPVLTDGDRLAAPSLPLSGRRTTRLRAAYLAALASAPQATISFAEANLRTGRKQLPSRWLLESASRHEGSPIDADAFARIRQRPWLIRQVSATSRLAGSLPYLTESEFRTAACRTAGLAAVASVTPRLRAGIELVRARRSSRFTRFDGNAGTGQAGLLPARTSPTRLERWARCPFQHFAGDVLRVAEFEEPEEIQALSPLDRGAIIHDALDAFYRETVDRPPGPWSAGERARLTAIALEECARVEALGRTGHGALWTIERTKILADLIDFLDSDAERSLELGTRFHAGELEFGEGPGSLPAVVFDLTPGRLEFRGRIDRVDREQGSDRYWVYDYKTGSAHGATRLDSDPLLGGERLQLPIYAEAVRSGMGATEVRAGYWYVSNTESFRLREVPLRQVLAGQLQQTLATIAAGVAGGQFVARPGSNNTNCGYCPYDTLCAADRERAYGRKAEDPALRPFVELKESAP
jgi:RecB family exonuclease